MAKRYSFGMVPWNGVFGTRQRRYYKHWPPGDPIKKDRDATRWGNTNVTRANHLYDACCWFICQGWPVEALEPFLDSIVPPTGWFEDFVDNHTEIPPDKSTYRKKYEYGPDFSALLDGYWEPKK